MIRFTHTTDVVGGFTAWLAQGLPIVPAPGELTDASKSQSFQI